ncbi:MAG: ABC transporter ATP-binding protein [Leptolyngbya sp. SIO3F4]|nr:ABC transporter ATP-binding protein [Leptolyngbya sp. SIO3F4]
MEHIQSDREPAVVAEDLHVGFLIQRQGINNFKDFIFRFGIGRPFERKEVLTGLNLTIYKGECFGIMGRNGSGKSTFLRSVAGIMPIRSGSLKVYGRVAPMMALGVGFEPELSGYENIRLLGVLMGLTRKQAEASIEAVQDFSELTTDHLEMQVKRYSSGMMARLAFAITVANDPEILIIDEALAVGDLGFQKKCAVRIDQIRESGGTIIYVSHHEKEIRRICDRACFLEDGKVGKVGDVEEILAYYEAQLVRHGKNKR